MTEEKKQSIGERLLQLRNQREMTQEGLAEYLDVSRQSVSKWELNKTLPDVEKLVQLSELYEVSIDYLVKGEQSSERIKGEENLLEEEQSEKSETDEDIGTGAMKDGETVSCEMEFGNVNSEYSARKVIFLLSMLFSGGLFAITLIFTAQLFCTHVFSFDDKEHDLVVINKIYEQYTKAEVWSENESGDYSRKTVWLDVPGVREEDFVDYYTNKDEPGSIFFEYYGRTLIMSLIVCLILLIFTIVFGMGWRMSTIKKERKEHGKENE